MFIGMSYLYINAGYEYCCYTQGRQDWQGPQGLGLPWILQNRKWRRQHAADVAATVAALPTKKWPWWPWLWFSAGLLI